MCQVGTSSLKYSILVKARRSREGGISSSLAKCIQNIQALRKSLFQDNHRNRGKPWVFQRSRGHLTPLEMIPNNPTFFSGFWFTSFTTINRIPNQARNDDWVIRLIRLIRCESHFPSFPSHFRHTLNPPPTNAFRQKCDDVTIIYGIPVLCCALLWSLIFTK